jgi:hypothetical protein
MGRSRPWRTRGLSVHFPQLLLRHLADFSALLDTKEKPTTALGIPRRHGLRQDCVCRQLEDCRPVTCRHSLPFLRQCRDGFVGLREKRAPNTVRE